MTPHIAREMLDGINFDDDSDDYGVEDIAEDDSLVG